MAISSNRIKTKSKRPGIAVVLGLGVNGLGIVRSLGRQKIRVLGIYTKDEEVGIFSKYCHAIKFPPLGKEDVQQFLSELIDLAKSYSERIVLFAESDLYVKFIVSNRKILDKYFVFKLPDQNFLEELLNKNKQCQLAEQFGLDIPKTFTFSILEDFYKQLDGMPYPCILKPNNSYTKIIPNNRKNLIFQNRSELIEFIENYPQTINDFVIQEIVEGGDEKVYYSTMYFDDHSNPLAIFTAKKIRQYKPKFGVTCYAESQGNPEIVRLATNFLKKLNFRGLVDIEFIKDERSNSYKFIELNPRTHLANSHSSSCDINLPAIAFMDAMGELDSNFKSPKQKNGIKWIYLSFDKGSFIRKYREKEISLIKWFKSIVQVRSFAVFAKDDLKPFLYSVVLFFKNDLINHLKK